MKKYRYLILAIAAFAGLASISVKSWLFVCFVGRFPAVLLTTLGGGALGSAKYGIVIAVILVFVVCYLFGMWWYKRLVSPVTSSG
ncbi:MAG TPA: hypothetical protein H9915_09405 [Candidatus Gemmiger faecigallinarum]|nr:hypothetical protein [Candidatus Gemmiger faecigallinarum]